MEPHLIQILQKKAFGTLLNLAMDNCSEALNTEDLRLYSELL